MMCTCEYMSAIGVNLCAAIQFYMYMYNIKNYPPHGAWNIIPERWFMNLGTLVLTGLVLQGNQKADIVEAIYN